MALLITSTDLANGTQATVAVSGSDIGSTNTIKAYSASLGTWSTVGSRTGDGNATCTFPAAGHYWLACYGAVSTIATISTIIPAVITSSSTAIWETILQTVLSDLQTLANAAYFPGLDGADDIERYTDIKSMFLAMKGPGLPAIGIAPGDTEVIKTITSAQDDIGYPVLLVYRDVADPKQEDDENASLKIIRERVRRRYIAGRLPGFSRAQTCNVEPMSAQQFEQMGYNGISSGQLFRWEVRENRGVF